MSIKIEGNPTPEEIAAVVAVLSSRPAASEDAETQPARSHWNAKRLRPPAPTEWRAPLR